MRAFFLVAVATIVAAGCGTLPADVEARTSACEALNADLASCIGGDSARLDCEETSEVDVDRMQTAIDTVGCTEMANMLPLDGDLRAATCTTMGSGCVAAVTAAPERRPTKYPVVLVNGIDTSPLFRWSERIQRVMKREGGHAVFLATLPPYEPPVRRSPLLWTRIQEIKQQTGAAKVNLVCHSLGGLDCRYVASPNGLAADLPAERAAIASSIASITTIGTAHRGTRVADVTLGLLPDWDRAKGIEAFAGVLGGWFTADTVDGSDPHLREALLALSTGEALAFNGAITDAEGVYYQSWAGVSRPMGEAPAAFDDVVVEQCSLETGEDGRLDFVRHDWMALPLLASAAILGRDDVPSDGLTPVTSARWGHFRGCLPADHMEQLGQKNLPDANVRNGFDVARFVTNVAGDLAAKGF